MINQIKPAVLMISAGIILILITLVLVFIPMGRWDNLLMKAALILGCAVALMFFAIAIRRVKA